MAIIMENFTSHAIRLTLCGDNVSDILVRIDADLGAAFYFEERIFLQYLGYTDAIAVRKRWKKDRMFECLASEWLMPSTFASYGIIGVGIVKTSGSLPEAKRVRVEVGLEQLAPANYVGKTPAIATGIREITTQPPEQPTANFSSAHAVPIPVGDWQHFEMPSGYVRYNKKMGRFDGHCTQAHKDAK